MSDNKNLKACPKCGKINLKSSLFCAACIDKRVDFENMQVEEPFQQFDTFLEETATKLMDIFIRPPLQFELKKVEIMDFLSKNLRSYSIVHNLMEENDKELLKYFKIKSGSDSDILENLINANRKKVEDSMYRTIETAFSCAIYFLHKYQSMYDPDYFASQSKKEQKRLKEIGFHLQYLMIYIDRLMLQRIHDTRSLTPKQQYKTYTNQILVMGIAAIIPSTVEKKVVDAQFMQLRMYVDARSQTGN